MRRKRTVLLFAALVVLGVGAVAAPVAADTPGSVDVYCGSGATLDGGGFNDGLPPPEVYVHMCDGTVLQPN